MEIDWNNDESVVTAAEPGALCVYSEGLGRYVVMAGDMSYELGSSEGRVHAWQKARKHLNIQLFERTRRSPSQPAENSQGGEPRPAWEMAKERVLAVYPNAFAWYDDDGTWFISLPHIGEFGCDDDFAEIDEQYAWLDADARLKTAALPAVQTQPPPSHPAPQGVCNFPNCDCEGETPVCPDHPANKVAHPAPKDSQQEDLTDATRAYMKVVGKPATPEVRHAPSSEIKNGGWISVDTDLPWIEHEVMVIHEDNGMQIQTEARRTQSHPKFFFSETANEYLLNVTHWREKFPLPKPPQFPEPRNEESHEA